MHVDPHSAISPLDHATLRGDTSETVVGQPVGFDVLVFRV
jgi:hypothetical protein